MQATDRYIFLNFILPLHFVKPLFTGRYTLSKMYQIRGVVPTSYTLLIHPHTLTEKWKIVEPNFYENLALPKHKQSFNSL